MRELFDFSAMNQQFAGTERGWFRSTPAPFQPKGCRSSNTLVAKTAAEVFSIAEKFAPQLHSYFSQPELA